MRLLPSSGGSPAGRRRLAVLFGALLWAAGLLCGPGLLAPGTSPVAGPEGELWMRVRLLQVLALLAGSFFLLDGIPRALPRPADPRSYPGFSTRQPWTARLGTWVPALVPAALLIAMGLLFRYGIYDDAYISLRYARNFARGAGLVFNPGERVEGYTCFSWVVLLGTLHRLTGLDLVALAETLGVAAGLATMAATARLLPRDIGPAGKATLLLPLAASLPVVLWSFSGMETSLFAALLVLGAGLSVRLPQRTAAFRAALMAGIVFALATLTRPEGLLYGCVALAAVLLWGPRRRRMTAGFAAGFGIPVAAHFAFRLAYYGDPLPNTWYAKVDGSSWTLVRYGAEYLGKGLVWVSPLLPLAVIGLLPRSRRADPSARGGSREADDPHARTERRARLLAAALVLAQAAAILYTGADHFGEMRFFVPILPFLVVLAAPGAARVAGWVRGAMGAGDPLPSARSGAGIVALAAAASLVISFFAGHVGYDSSLRYGPVIAERWARIGEWLGKEAKPEDLLATPVAGAIPYVSGLRTLDMQGLTDRTIAHEKRQLGGRYKDHEKWDVDYVLGRRPDWVFLGHFGVTSLADFRSRPKLPVLEALSKRLPLPGYMLISGRYRGEAFTFLRRSD